MDVKQLKQDYLAWESQQTQFNPWSENVFEVENQLVDAYGRKPFILVEDRGDHYTVTDDGYLMYKYNPLEENEDLNEYAAGMILDAGFDFDEEHGVIYRDVDGTNLPAVISGLMQLEIMMSYLA